MLRVNEKLVLALPKGRILKEVMPLISLAGIKPEKAFDDQDDRRLRFSTNLPELDIIRVRSFDVATFVAFGAAHLGICGNDVLMEFDYPEIYAPVDLGLGKCRLVIAEPNASGWGDSDRCPSVRTRSDSFSMPFRPPANKSVGPWAISFSIRFLASRLKPCSPTAK